MHKKTSTVVNWTRPPRSTFTMAQFQLQPRRTNSVFVGNYCFRWNCWSSLIKILFVYGFWSEFCSFEIKTHGGTTTVPHVHLKSKHNIVKKLIHKGHYAQTWNKIWSFECDIAVLFHVFPWRHLWTI